MEALFCLFITKDQISDFSRSENVSVMSFDNRKQPHRYHIPLCHQEGSLEKIRRELHKLVDKAVDSATEIS